MNANDKQRFASVLQQVFVTLGKPPEMLAVEMWWRLMEPFAIGQFELAMNQYILTGKFAPKPADIIGLIHSMDGRPDADEAWAMIPRDEAATVVMTEEMSMAMAVAAPLLEEGDQVAARMAFKSSYIRHITEARQKGTPTHWFPSLGHDPSGRESVLKEALMMGRLLPSQVAGLLPYNENGISAIPELQTAVKRIEGKNT